MSDTKTSFAQGQLKSLIERIERLEEEKATISGDIKEVYAEAKGNGFDTKILRKVISLRKKDRNEREEEQAMLDLYMAALGMMVQEDEPDTEETLAQENARVEELFEGQPEEDELSDI